MLCAEQGPFGLALMAAAGSEAADAWGRCSVGCLEGSDGWQDFHRQGRMRGQYERAGPGGVTLRGELPPVATLALGLGTSPDAAATLAHAALLAKYRLKDLPLALRYATAVDRLTTARDVPDWAKQMRLFILEDMDELQAAKIMLGGLLASGQIKDPVELRFLKQHLEQLEARITERNARRQAK